MTVIFQRLLFGECSNDERFTANCTVCFMGGGRKTKYLGLGPLIDLTQPCTGDQLDNEHVATTATA